MEFFNFENNFEIEVNHPQVEVFTKFEAYVIKQTWKIIHSDHKEFVSFQTRTALIAITFIANNDNSTTLSITTKTKQFDYNKSIGVIHKILKECFSDQIYNVKEEHNEAHNEVQYPNSNPKQKKKQRRRKTYDNYSRRKFAFGAAIIALFAIAYLYPSVSSYIKEHRNSSDIEDTYESEAYNEPKRTEKKEKPNRPGWLLGSWRCELAQNGVLIVNLSSDAEVKVMNGFTTVSKIEYDEWTILNNMLYLYNKGEKVSDSPSFYIDYNNRTIIGHTGERFQKH